MLLLLSFCNVCLGSCTAYIPAIEAALPRLLWAAAPQGIGAQENRLQCLKVLFLLLKICNSLTNCSSEFRSFFFLL